MSKKHQIKYNATHAIAASKLTVGNIIINKYGETLTVSEIEEEGIYITVWGLLRTATKMATINRAYASSDMVTLAEVA
jgi:hypothetical protein